MIKIGRLHIPKFRVFNIIFFAVAFTIIPSLIEMAYERFMPTSNWFLYEVGNEVELVGDYYTLGEDLVFKSNSKVFRGIDLRWEDTLYCRENGNMYKYLTQYWPLEGTERKSPPTEVGNHTDVSWSYTAEDVRETSKECKICGTIIGYTLKHRYEKTQSYCSDFFEVRNK